jgi:hypothetical protein
VPSSNRRTWIGPKEWRPPRPELWMDSSLLSKEENKRISLLFAESQREGGLITKAEVAWVCETIKKLGHCGPDDYKFPARLAFFNPMILQAYAMRYAETLLIECSHHFQGPFTAANIFAHQTSSQPPEAIMLIRPYLKVTPPSDPMAVRSLRASTILMKVDRETVLRTPVDEHLILEDGSFPRKNRWSWRPSSGSILFRACPLVDENAHASIIEGISCPNGTMIHILLDTGVPFEGDITLTTGLVAARYRAIDGPIAAGVIP